MVVRAEFGYGGSDSAGSKSSTRTGMSPDRGQHGGSSRRSGGGGGSSGGGSRSGGYSGGTGSSGGYSGGSGSTSGGGSPGINSIDAKELAQLAGFSVAFFKHNDELKKVFEDALRLDYSPDRLLAAARNTNWFKKHSEAARKAILLKTSDPAEYKRQMKQTKAAVKKMVNELGVPVDGFTLSEAAKLALHGGWNETQIRNYVTKFGSVADAIREGKTLEGLAGETVRGLRELSGAYGIKHSTDFLANATDKVVRGATDMDFYQNYFIDRAMSKYAGIAKQIEAGMTVAQIAEPYVDSMARLLEMNPEKLDVFDNMIQKALISKDKEGKPAAKTIWQFEEDVRKDPRWMKTNNAREDLLSAGRQVLRDFGLSF